MRLAVIPARGGSKRIPRKNIRIFCGKPIMAWSIEAARESGCFDRIVVSTDDEEIASTACAYGAEVPFLRPRDLASDHAGTQEVIAHAIQWVEENMGKKFTEVCCLYATAPFVRASDLRDGLEVLRRNNCGFAFPVTTYPFPIQRAVRITGNNRVEMFNPQHCETRSQDMEIAYHDAGQFYWGRSEAWLEGRPIFSNEAAPIILPRLRVQDIDTPEDWEIAEIMYKVLQASDVQHAR